MSLIDNLVHWKAKSPGNGTQDGIFGHTSQLNLFTQPQLRPLLRDPSIARAPQTLQNDNSSLTDLKLIMTTHLPSWSKMSFQKKSKPTASVGNPSPKTLRKSKSTRTTKSEARVDPDNNNSQESLEQEFDKKLDLESKFRCQQKKTYYLHGFLFYFILLKFLLNFWCFIFIDQIENCFSIFSTCCLRLSWASGRT